MTEIFHGSCACGGVAFRATGPLRALVACHCGQCRRTSGHFWTATSVPNDRFKLLRDQTLHWYRSSEAAERGFCNGCGATALLAPDRRRNHDHRSFDDPLGMAISEHIYTEDASDYYAIPGIHPAESSAPERLDCACLCGKVRFCTFRPGPGRNITTWR